MCFAKVIKDTLTGADGETYDYAKVGGVWGILCLCVGAVYHLWDDNLFDSIAFATAFSIIVGAVCGGVYLKNKGGDMPPTKEG